jgi:phosphatidyl-myo-inositol dimannoside synthase
MVPQAELPKLYQRAAMAVFPFIKAGSGDQEGFGLVVVEAMGCGCPVIASDLPAIQDSINHGKSGILIPPGKPELFAQKIKEFLLDQHLSKRIGREGGKRVMKEFDWEVIAGKYRKLYVNLTKHID